MDPQFTLDDHVRAAQAGNTNARELLARRALTLALATTRTIVGNAEDARDIAQDAAIDVMRALKELRVPGAFDAWVHRSAARRAIRATRRERLRHPFGPPQTLDEALVDPSPEPTERAEQAGYEAAIARALRGLPSRQRAAISLRYLFGLSEPEVAAALGCSVGTAASLLSRGRAALRALPELRDLLPGPDGVTPND
jgi:RNA polymerase sigma-70 factor, ECF subfamily